MSKGWKKATRKIAVLKIEMIYSPSQKADFEERDGWLKGAFFITRADHEEGWTISNVPTGGAIDTVRTLVKAKELADQLAALPYPWDDPKNGGDEAKHVVRDRVTELLKTYEGGRIKNPAPRKVDHEIDEYAN